VAGGALSAAAIDAALGDAVERGRVPGVVAMAATADGIAYSGAFGTRELAKAAPMTLDTVFRIASMTKAVTSVAAMQLVEAGKIALDDPVPDIDPALSHPQVLAGFDTGGAPVLRPAGRPIALRHLLTHTAGFSYDMWDANTLRYMQVSGLPSPMTGRVAALRQPLAFDPGDRWEYGINIDWVGRIVEAVSGQPLDEYFRKHIFAPLGMTDSGFMPTAEQHARRATLHQRVGDGRLEPQPLEMPPVPEFWAGGGGLFSTAPDYLTFLRMLLAGGSLAGARILKPETVALMGENHIGELQAGVMKTTSAARSNDVDFFPGAPVRWGLGYLINQEPGPHGRSPGSLAWAGLFNTYYWIDPRRGLAALILTQILPFADARVLDLYGAFERAIYTALDAG